MLRIPYFFSALQDNLWVVASLGGYGCRDCDDIPSAIGFSAASGYDTHTLIWLDQDVAALGKTARYRADEALKVGGLAVSALSFWETAMLAAKGSGIPSYFMT
jgi:hypothetical protein